MMPLSSVTRSSADGMSRGFGCYLLRALRALDDHWIGDLIGALSLFASLWALLVIGWALS